jgi:hypothetical protein
MYCVSEGAVVGANGVREDFDTDVLAQGVSLRIRVLSGMGGFELDGAGEGETESTLGLEM